MLKPLKRIAITGGAGQIAYSLLFRIANGDLLGKEQPIALHILEVESALTALDGVRMELEDCAFPLLKELIIGCDPYKVFDGIHYAMLVGAKPRGPGMERSDLLNDNGKIFIEQGKALDSSADRNVKVLVVGNPCNTNCLIAMHHAPRIPRKNFYAMTRLDQNRASSMLARKAKMDVTEIQNVTIWGNHSATQVPDFFNATADGKPIPDVIKDTNWLESDFISAVQKRGAAIIAARGKSSAASAASAAIDALKSVITPTPPGQWYSSGVCSDVNPYQIQEDLIFSFPCRTTEEGEHEIVKGLPWNDFLKYKIKLTEKELIDEKDLIQACLGGGV